MSADPPFAALIAATAVSRLVELAISRRNVRALECDAARRGGEVRRCESRGAFAAMAALHALLLAAPLAEHLLSGRRAGGALLAAALAAWCCGQILRWWSVHALGASWNAVCAVSSLQPVVATGPYRVLRHPNYLGVLLEAVAIPAAGAAWWSALALAPSIAWITRRRLLAEERLLEEILPHWKAAFSGRPRLVPLPGRTVRR